ncbi:MAG: hypothetical protein ACK4Y5_06670 [Acetobacteraceae bacterium]|jgi:hypothetical protein
MSDRRPAQTIGELDIHLGNVQARLAEIAHVMNGMATKHDVTRIEAAMAQLATKAEVAAEIKAIRDEVHRSKPATLLRNFMVACAAIAGGAAGFGIVLEIFRWLEKAPK